MYIAFTQQTVDIFVTAVIKCDEKVMHLLQFALKGYIVYTYTYARALHHGW